MQEFISSLKEAQLESTSPTDITLSLVRFQTEINALFFHGLPANNITEAFQEIWKFFLYAASHSQSGVRLAAYRATGAFLLKLSPYYTSIIQNTFSDVSMVATIDVKSSAIIASSFAFISSRISLPYLDKFLDNTPVFHHFTISDPIFSEHLSSIISNLGELGFDWFSTLLHSFLSLSETSKDRYLMKSITSVITHDPINLMNDFLQYIYDQNSYKNHLPLASYIITTGHIYDNSFDLFNLAKASINILNHPEESNPTMIDSAFQILSVKSPSFYLQVDPVDNDTINLTLSKKKPDQSMDLIDFDLSDKNENNEHISIVIKVSVFKIRPTIYLLELPIIYSEPTSEDGALTLTAKFKSLASIINAYPEKTPAVLSTFIKFYKKEYDSTVSAVIQGISECISTLINNSDLIDLIPLIESVIFTPYTNWFHSADILSVIDNMPQDSFEKLFGRTGEERIISLLIELSISANIQVSIKATKIIRKLATSQTFQKLTTIIASHIDIFDDTNLSHLLPLLTDILRDHTGENFTHLHFLVFQLIELQDFYRTNLPVLTSLLHFIGNFTINFVKSKKLNPTFLLAVSIIAASIQCVSGFSEWENIFQFESLSNMVEIISNDLRLKNIDVSSENSLNYDEYLAPCVAALKFVYGIPVNMIQKDFILILYKKLRNIFPLDSAKFVRKFWQNFTDEERIQAILKMHKSLRFVQKYTVASIITNLFIQIYKPAYFERLDHCKKALLHIASYALKNKRCLEPDEETVFKALFFITDEKNKETILNSTPEFEKDVLKHCPELYKILFKKPNPNVKGTADPNQIVNLIPSQGSMSDPNVLDNPYKIKGNSSSGVFDFTDPNFGTHSPSSSQVDILSSNHPISSSNMIFASANPISQNNLLLSNSSQKLKTAFSNDLLSNTLVNLIDDNKNTNQKSNFEDELFAPQQPPKSQPMIQDDLFAPQQQNAQSSIHDDLFAPNQTAKEKPNFHSSSEIIDMSTNDLFSPQQNTNTQNIHDDLLDTSQQTTATSNNQQAQNIHDDLFSTSQQTTATTNNQEAKDIHDDLFGTSQQTTTNNQEAQNINDDLFGTSQQTTTNNQEAQNINDDLFGTSQQTATNNQEAQNINDDLFGTSQQTTTNNQEAQNINDDLFGSSQAAATTTNNQQAQNINDDLFGSSQQTAAATATSAQQVQETKNQDKIIDISNSSSQIDYQATRSSNSIYEKKFVFTKPPTDLTAPLSPTDPLVKLQIKKSTRSFSADELSQIVSHLVKIDDISGLKLVLQHCVSKNIQVSVKGLNFSEKVLPIVLRYLRLVKSPELESIISPLLYDELVPYPSYLQIVVSNTSRYLKHITDSEKVTKALMKNFGSMIPVAQFAQKELVSAVLHCLTKAKSTRKLNYSLVLVQNALLVLKEIPADFVRSIFSVFDTKMKELNYFTQCQILYILSAKIPNEPKVTEYAIEFKAIISSYLPELFYIYSIIENLSKSGSQIFAKEIPKVCDELLNSHTPSTFITGMNLFTYAQKTLTGDRLQSLMRHSFNHITRRLTKTFKFWPIPELTTPALINILTLPVFKKHQQNLVSSLDGIIPSINSASFQTYFVILTLSVGIVDEKQKFADEQLMIERISNELISNRRANIEFFVNLYIKIVKSHAEKMTPKSKQENYVMSKVNNFIEKYQKNCDFYELARVVCELLTTLNMFNGFTQLLPIMSDHIFTNSPRFFPTFVGVALFVRKFRSANANNQDILNKMNSSFIGAGKRMMQVHRSRGVALQLLADPSKMKIALDLASFNDDCRESDLMLEKLNLNVIVK